MEDKAHYRRSMQTIRVIFLFFLVVIFHNEPFSAVCHKNQIAGYNKKTRLLSLSLRLPEILPGIEKSTEPCALAFRKSISLKSKNKFLNLINCNF